MNSHSYGDIKQDRSNRESRTKIQKSSVGIRSIGFVKKYIPPSGDKGGYGFILSNGYGLNLTQTENGQGIEFYFKISEWPLDAGFPEEGKKVSFKVVEYPDGHKAAIRIVPLTFTRQTLETALFQAAKYPVVSGWLRSLRRNVRYNVIRLVLDMAPPKSGDGELVRSTILSCITRLPEADRNIALSNWFSDTFVASYVRNLFSNYVASKYGDISELIRRQFRVELTDEVRRAQDAFIDYVNLRNYQKRELIVLLENEGGKFIVREVRCPDFSIMERYKTFPMGGNGKGVPVEGVLPIVGRWEDIIQDHSGGYYSFGWKFTNANQSNLGEIGINPTKPASKLSADEIITRLHDAAMRMEGGVAKQISRTHDTIEKQLTEAGDDVFIYELLQNANDYPLKKGEMVDVRIALEANYLRFEHTGAAFTPKNVAAICSVNDQDKSDNPNTIGYKGIGFKTVFRYNNRVDIRTGAFNFSFDESIKDKKDGIPWRTTPILISSLCNHHEHSNYHVSFVLYPRQPLRLQDGPEGYGQILQNTFADERALLFIPNLRKVILSVHGKERQIECRSGNWCVSATFIERISDEIQDDIEQQLNDKEKCRIPPKYRGMTKTQVSFACRKSGRGLMPENDGCLYCFLPAKEARWGFKFLMNTDMIPNGPRNDIEYSISVNKYFTRVAGEKFFDWIDSLIRSGEYDYDSIFELIPNFDECKKNRPPKVVEFIQEFQDGFESRVAELQIPSSKGDLAPASSIVYDSTGVLKELGESVWERLACGGMIVHKSLRDSKDFDSFIKRYKRLLGIQEFDFDKLVEAVANEPFQGWLMNPMTNQQFFKYLDGKGKLELFKSAKIFLDDKGKLGTPQEMYFHADVEKYLKDFAYCFRYLPSSAPCRDKLEKDWFIQLAPRKLVREILFSCDNEGQTRERLKNVCTARMFFGFLARYKTYTRTYYESYIYYGRQRTRQVQKQEERFTRKFLESLPVVLENGETVNTIAATEYSVFLPEQTSAQSIVANYNWIGQGWVRFLNVDYFDCDDGNTIREWFKEEHGQGDNAWKLVCAWNIKDVLTAIAGKFVDDIRKRMIDLRSDLGFYDFIYKCIDERCINLDWIKQRLSGWPVFDDGETIVESSGKAVFYCSDSILHWVNSGWLDDQILVLNKKYSTQKKLFDILGAQEFAENNFGEKFSTLLVPHLNLDTREKVIAFHRFMATKKNLLNGNQVAELQKAPIFVKGDVKPVVGLDGVYLPTKIDIGNEIAAGVISAEIKVLDDELCDDSTIEYWKWLGVKSLDEVEILKKRLEKYLERQKEFVENGTNDVAFKEYHKAFIKTLASGDTLQMLKDSGCGDLIKAVRLFTKGGELLVPTEMRLSKEFKPLCDFESFVKSGAYVSEMYCGIENISEHFKELGVKDNFSEEDVALLANKEFCEYFWTTYLSTPDSIVTVVKILDNAKQVSWYMPNASGAPCLVDTLYSPKMREYYDVVNGAHPLDSVVVMYYDVESFKGLIDMLRMRTELGMEEGCEWLLKSNPDDKRRVEVLGWIASTFPNAQEVSAWESYRNNQNAKWLNGERKPIPFGDLYLLSENETENARIGSLRSSRHVLNLEAICGGKGARRQCIDAFKKLGCQVITDNMLKPEYSDMNDETIEMRLILKQRILACVAAREGSDWFEHYMKAAERIEKYRFVQCRRIRFMFEKLVEDNEGFLSDSDCFYYVNDWLNNLVFADFTDELLSESKLNITYDIASVRRILIKTREQLVDFIVTECDEAFRSGDEFVKTLNELQLLDDVLRIKQKRKQEGEASPGNENIQVTNEHPVSEQCQQTADHIGTSVTEVDTLQKDSPVLKATLPVTEDSVSDGNGGQYCSLEGVLPEDTNHNNASKKMMGEYEVDDDEYTQLSRIFAGGDTSDDAETQKRKDESKLACLRLFNRLEAQELEPSMDGHREIGYVVRELYAGLGKTGPNIDINTGERLHVISAMGGVGYIPPSWWNKVAQNHNGRNVICAVTGAGRENYVLIRNYDDILRFVGDNAIPVKIRGANSEERVRITTDWFSLVDTQSTAGKIYALLKLREKTSMNSAFMKGYCSDEMSEYEATHNNDL